MRARVDVGIAIVVPLVAACEAGGDPSGDTQGTVGSAARCNGHHCPDASAEGGVDATTDATAEASDAGTDADAATDAPGADAGTVLFSDDFESFPVGDVWAEGTMHGAWQAVFDGFGQVWIASDGSNVLSLRPEAATSKRETHSALVTSTASFGDLDLAVRAHTVTQLRAQTPNPWEVAWVLWHYTDNTHFYYVILKPNGWELGKEDPAYPGSQRFLATGSSPTFAIGVWRNVGVRQVENAIAVTVDGVPLVTFTDQERPYVSGKLGLYTEDAESHYDDVIVRAPD
jgi:hypothetical protein